MTRPRQGEPAGTSGGPDYEVQKAISSSHPDCTTDHPSQQDSKHRALWHLARATAGASDYDESLVKAYWPEAPAQDAASLRNWLRGNPSLAVTIARLDPEVPPEQDAPQPSNAGAVVRPKHAPPLPDYAALSAAQLAEAAQAGAWLDDYIAFASQASPLTPRSFHEGAGLFAGSLAIARRLHLDVGVLTIYPNLYMLFIGRSTLPRKTTGMRVLRGLLAKADMEPFLLAGRQTPEALMLDLTTRFPKTYEDWPSDQQAMWLRERAFAAQRGWQLEEASHLLESFERDYSAGLLPIVLDLYDCHEQGPARNTISRGRERVERPYLSIFGATTFGAVAGHLSEAVHWHNGLWARFALVSSSGHGDWQFFPDQMKYPPQLVKRLQFLAYELLPVPEARVVTQGGDEGGGERMEVDVDALASRSVHLSSRAWNQWESYARAMGYDMLLDGIGIPDKLYANYGRLGTMLVKVAVILAAFDANALPVNVETKHVYRAQMIVEGWRDSLHRIVFRHAKAKQAKLRQRVLQLLEEKQGSWVTQRDLQRSLDLTLEELQPVIKSLDGRVEVRDYKPQRGPSSLEYRMSEEK